jgi:rhodanese-related sulfurtransferase
MKNKTYIIIGSALILIVAVLLMLTPASSATKLTGKDFIEKYNSTQSSVLLDVRTPEEFNAGHIQSAINIDFQNQSFLSDIKNLDNSKTYFVYCRSGNRSGKAISIMNENGFKNIYELQEGILSSPELIK